MRAIFHMLRIPNLVIIALTFFILRYFVFIPVYARISQIPCMGNLQFSVMVFTTMLIAAAGYISNDYFDIVTDRVNKPHKIYIGNQISAGTTFAIAVLLSLLAISLAIWLSMNLKSWLPALMLCTALFVALWYASALKKSFIWGNVAVSCMSAGTIAMAWIIEKQISRIHGEPSDTITNIVIGISVFAFLLSMMREIVKDLEDMEGDRLINCRSLPLVKGLGKTKQILIVFSLLTIGLLIASQTYLIQYSRLSAVLWLAIVVEIPLVFFILKLRTASLKNEFRKLSMLLKWIMVGGIGTLIAGQF